MAELTRDVKSELRFDSYAELGVYFCWAQPPKTKESIEEEEENEGIDRNTIMNEKSKRREVVEVVFVFVFAAAMF